MIKDALLIEGGFFYIIMFKILLIAIKNKLIFYAYTTFCGMISLYKDKKYFEKV